MTDPRPEAPAVGDERATLTGFLDRQRATLLVKCADLDPEQLARRSVAPSSLSLLGLVRHLADTERGWFGRVAGREEPPIFFTEQDENLDFDGAVGEPAVVDEAFAAWHEQVARSRAITEATSLDATFAHPVRGPVSLRWVLGHMIEEYARHLGHADLLREAVDGRTGE